MVALVLLGRLYLCGMTFSVTILGAASAKPSAARHQTSQLINHAEQYFLVDAGEGVQSRLMRRGVNPMRLTAVFISHLHGDHIFGLFPMISSLGLMGRKLPLHIFAPAPFGEILEYHTRYFDTKLPYQVVWHEVDTTSHALLYENKVLEVWSVPLRHRVPTAGFLFREKPAQPNVDKAAIERYGLGIAQITAAKRGEDVVLADGSVVPNSEITYIPWQPRSYAYLSDTNYSGKAVSLVKGVDLLYHEATYADDMRSEAKKRGHSTTLQAARAAVESGARRLIVGHFSSRYKNEQELVEECRTVFPESYLAEEYKCFDIEMKKLVK